MIIWIDEGESTSYWKSASLSLAYESGVGQYRNKMFFKIQEQLFGRHEK